MKVKYDPRLYKILKKLNVKILKQFGKAIIIFEKNPYDLRLDNHQLRNTWKGYRSIHIGDRKNDYCAVYEEIKEKNETVAYFVIVGTHKQLFG